MKRQSLEGAFAAPPKIYSPVPIWWWSGEPLVKERLRWQMERLVEGGVFNVLILNLAPDGPLFGSDPDEPPFLSEGWWDCFLFVLEQAEQLGMLVWFYDQLGFSGARLQDRLVFAHPEFRGATVQWIEVTVSGGESVSLQPPPKAVPLAAHAVPADGEGNARCLAVFFEGTPTPLRWQAPSGRWRVILFFAVPSKFDYLNPKACAALFNTVHGEMERRAGKYLGKVLVGSFQDEFPMLPLWTWRFPDEFRKRKGYEVREWMPALFFPTSDEGMKVRCDVREVLTNLAEEAFFRPLFEWHEKHGLLCGYDQTNRNADPIEGQRWYLDYWKTMRWYSAPGQDHGGDAKPHAAIAQCYRRQRVWLEGFHSSGWGHTIDELTGWLHRWYQRGANLYNPHGIYYSTKGSWWEWAPPSTCWRQPYWRNYRFFAEHITRLSYLLSQGTHVCPLAVLNPSTTVHAHMGLGEPDEVARACQKIYWALVGNPNWWGPQLGVLDKNGRDFTVLDEDTLESAKMQRGALIVGQNRIRIVMLPGVDVLRAKSFERLLALAKAGGTVIAVGRVPQQILGKPKGEIAGAVKELFGVVPESDHEPHSEVAFPSGGRGVFVKDPNEVPAVLNQVLPRTVEGVPYLHRRIGREDFFFVVHPKVFSNLRPVEGTNLEPLVITAKFAVKGAPHLWDTTTGEVKPLPARERDGVVEVDLDFSVASGLVLSFRRGKLKAPQPIGEETVLELDGLWDIAYEPTLDNRWGDFNLPVSSEPRSPEGASGVFVPVQVRRFRHRTESDAEDGLILKWHSPETDDKDWEQITYSFGTYLLKRGPFRPEQAPSVRVEGNEPGWQPVRFSLKLGIENDPIHHGTLGPKGHVPEEFVDLGEGAEGEQFDLFTCVVSAKERTAWLCVGGRSGKEAWLNGEKVMGFTDGDIAFAPVKLRAGQNTLLLRLTRRVGRLRAFFQFLDMPTKTLTPHWIWFPELPYPDFGIPHCWRAFRRTLTLPAPVQSAWIGVVADSGYRLWVNGHFIGEGHIDRRQTALQKHDITNLLQPGKNGIAVRAWTEGGAAALLVYGGIVSQNEERLLFVSDPSWRVGAWAIGKEPSNWMEPSYDDSWWGRAMSQGIPPTAPWGSVEGLPKVKSPHPLPRGGWLEGEPNRPFEPLFEPFPDRTKRVSWLRFLLPPGANKMHAKVKGQMKVFVDGQEIEPDSDGAYPLPQPHKERRLCALRVVTEQGYPEAAAVLEPLTFDVSNGRMGLGAWADWGLSCYAGGIVYEKSFGLTTESPSLVPRPAPQQSSFVLDLGKVRGTAEVWLNGQKIGVRAWAPYRFDLTGKLRDGENLLRIVVYSSLGPHFSQAIPTPYLFAEQRLAGLFGPVRLVKKSFLQ